MFIQETTGPFFVCAAPFAPVHEVPQQLDIAQIMCVFAVYPVKEHVD